ncbi:MAG: hypothetical protein V2I33_21235, partial [Kangiellaceae bacterium]|nr:hypothetical protein [Kangiellaceae bacterium]
MMQVVEAAAGKMCTTSTVAIPSRPAIQTVTQPMAAGETMTVALMIPTATIPTTSVISVLTLNARSAPKMVNVFQLSARQMSQSMPIHIVRAL